MPLRFKKDDPIKASADVNVEVPESAPPPPPAISSSSSSSRLPQNPDVVNTNPTTPTVEKNPMTPAAKSTNDEERGWQPLRSVRKAAAAVHQSRMEKIQEMKLNEAMEVKDTDIVSTSTSTGTDANTNIDNAASASTEASEAAPTTPSQSKPKASESKFSYFDSFSFAPNPTYQHTSSCDVDPPDFNAPSNLKMSNNFSKLITNAKRVDKSRARAKRDAAPPIDANETIEDIMRKGKDGNEEISVDEAQKRLIDQLKNGVNFLSLENRDLMDLKKELEAELAQEKQLVMVTQNEVIERNLKLAVLEDHFRTINDHNNQSQDDIEGVDVGVDVGVGVDAGNDSILVGKSTDDENEADGESGTSELKTSAPKVSSSQTSSSIIQIDKGYFRELEANVKKEKAEREKMEKVNEDLAMKYATLERESKKEVEHLTKEAADHTTELESQIERQERTIESLEMSLSKSRELLFKKEKKGKKSHRRRATVNNIPNTEEFSRTSEDEHSLSAAASVATNDPETDQDILQKEFVQDAIAAAVKEAIEEQGREHKLSMDSSSKQLELKDNHINSLESKMRNILKNKNNNVSPQRTMRKDVMVRNIAVTSEVLDTSMRKLENMMDQIGRTANEKRTETEDPMDPIRRIATRISLVHEEMKVSIKLFQQKIQNVEAKQPQPKEQEQTDGIDNGGNDENDPDVTSKQTSGENAETTNEPSVVELIANATKSLKETESSIREEIGLLKDHLQTVEYGLAANADTIEALELACAENEESYRALQKDYEELKAKTDDEGDDSASTPFLS